MSVLAAFARRHPLPTFFLLAYGASWALWAPLVLNHGGLPAPPGTVLLLLGSLVPSTVAIVLTGVQEGRVGIRQLLRRLLLWRVGRWYLLLLAPMIMAVLAISLSRLMTLLLAPLGNENLARPFWLLSGLMLLAALVVIAAFGPTDLVRRRRLQYAAVANVPSRLHDPQLSELGTAREK